MSLLSWVLTSNLLAHAQVKEFEVAQVAAALAALEGSETHNIKITYIVIQKRHHTRLFPAQPKDGDRNGNVLPGLCLPSVSDTSDMCS